MTENKKTPQDINSREELYLKEILKQTLKTNYYFKTLYVILLLRMLGQLVIFIRSFLNY